MKLTRESSKEINEHQQKRAFSKQREMMRMIDNKLQTKIIAITCFAGAKQRYEGRIVLIYEIIHEFIKYASTRPLGT